MSQLNFQKDFDIFFQLLLLEIEPLLTEFPRIINNVFEVSKWLTIIQCINEFVLSNLIQIKIFTKIPVAGKD